MLYPPELRAPFKNQRLTAPRLISAPHRNDTANRGRNLHTLAAAALRSQSTRSLRGGNWATGGPGIAVQQCRRAAL